MTDNSMSLGLPFLAAAQAKKHVTINEVITRLDVFVQLRVKDRSLNTPPANPAEGDQYVIGTDPSLIWQDRAGDIAVFHDGNWNYFQPSPGLVAIDMTTLLPIVWTGDIWEPLSTETELTSEYIGLNAVANGEERLIVSSPLVTLVRRYIICPRFRPGLRETLLICLVDIRRRLCGIASVGVR